MNEINKPGPRPSLHAKRFRIHYRVNTDMLDVIHQLRVQLRCKSNQDVLDEAVRFLATKMRTPAFMNRWYPKKKKE